jgi:predicted RNase H-like nuclease
VADAGAKSPDEACIGIDGCRGGWVWCGRLDGRWQGGVVARLEQIRLDQIGLALIDMPIGLVEQGGDERHCDREARALLGRPRASSVFRPPCRGALEASDYPRACAINRACTGVALSKQTWNISPKIRELDQLLCDRRELRRALREAHPELCLWGLAGGRPMQHHKRTPRGREERLALLRGLDPDCIAMIKALEQAHRRRILAVDDIVDATVLALTALASLQARPRILPAQPQLDARGLAMQLLFVLP